MKTDTEFTESLRFKKKIAGATSLIVIALATSSYSAHAQAGGSVIVAANAWLGGNGVDVHWNAGDCCCGWGNSYTICPSTGASVYTGCEWQCVELAQRLYTTRNWRCGNFSVNYA